MIYAFFPTERQPCMLLFGGGGASSILVRVSPLSPSFVGVTLAVASPILQRLFRKVPISASKGALVMSFISYSVKRSDPHWLRLSTNSSVKRALCEGDGDYVPVPLLCSLLLPSATSAWSSIKRFCGIPVFEKMFTQCQYVEVETLRTQRWNHRHTERILNGLNGTVRFQFACSSDELCGIGPLN